MTKKKFTGISATAKTGLGARPIHQLLSPSEVDDPAGVIARAFSDFSHIEKNYPLEGHPKIQKP